MALDTRQIVETQSRWTACLARGDADIARLAQRALSGAKLASEIIGANLRAIGYPNVPGVIGPDAGLDFRIKALEARIGGSLNPMLACFWREVGSVCLCDPVDYAHVAFWEQHGIERVCDGVEIDGCSDEWLSFALDWLAEDDSLTELPLCPDALHKDDISGGSPYCIDALAGWDAPLLNFEWSDVDRPESAKDRCDLVSYLRTALLECAGFPGLYGEPAFDALRPRLLAGVKLF
ncbi:MAG: hypothetical protein HYV17_08530 [Xanthomonadales bacterium]|nr:hypothetical protein [Xanthomonadales bacterium]